MKVNLTRKAILITGVWSIALAIPNCSNGSSQFTEAPPSKEAESFYNAYESYAAVPELKLSFEQQLNAKIDADEESVDELTIGGQLYKQLRSRFKQQFKDGKSRPKASLGAFLKAEKDLGTLTAKDFDLADKIYPEVIKNLGDKNKYEAKLGGYSQLEISRALRAGAFARALVTVAKKYESSSGKSGSAGLNLAAPAAAAAGAKVADKLIENLPKILEATGGMATAFANAHESVQRAEGERRCNHMKWTCDQFNKSDLKVKQTDNDVQSSLTKEWKYCKDQPPPRVCTYGEARSHASGGELRAGNDTRNCSMYKMWKCWCKDQDKRDASGAFVHADGDNCQGAPESRQDADYEAWTAQQPLIKSSVNSEAAGKACTDHATLCAEK